jgi:hypothetical protein
VSFSVGRIDAREKGACAIAVEVEGAREVVFAAKSKGSIRFVGGSFGSRESESCSRACGEGS